MVIVVFEVSMAESEKQRYMDLAAELRAALDKIDGFISVERFQSMATAGKYVSLSFWRDEDAVRAWREHPEHGTAQIFGKNNLFSDYRITVGQVLRSYGPEGPR